MATSLKDYLKKYQSVGEDDNKQPKKTKKKRKVAQVKVPVGLVIVDNDAAWQKTIDEDSDEPEVEGIDAPQVIEDVEVKRMHQMERIKQHRPYMSIGDDGSGWSTVERKPKNVELKGQRDDTLRLGSPDISPPRRNPSSQSQDISPPRRRNSRPGSPDASPPRKQSQVESEDISPPRRRNMRAESPDASPPRKRSQVESEDISPPRRRNARAGSPDTSPPRRRYQVESEDISPPRRRNARPGSPDASPPRKRTQVESEDISPPRRRKARADSPDASPPRRPPAKLRDISPTRRKKSRADFQDSPLRRTSRSQSEDISPPRKKKPRTDSSPRRRVAEQVLSPNVGRKPVKMTDGRQAGLITDKAERVAELAKKKQEDARRLKEMGGGGRAAETVYRDKRGKRLEGLEELLRQQQGEAKPEVKPLEWGKGLAQKRETEERHAEFEAEKNKPFARTRDDPEYDKMFKERLRWGDPMAHLVKRKDPAAELVDFGASDEMKESGFIIPQDIPAHSWLKRGVGAPMNRYVGALFKHPMIIVKE
uniref:BUD13 homolog n=1 Tax=Physcomitrium patens TaxID=3218 RepID=A0A7I4FLG9_PHYPA